MARAASPDNFNLVVLYNFVLADNEVLEPKAGHTCSRSKERAHLASQGFFRKANILFNLRDIVRAGLVL